MTLLPISNQMSAVSSRRNCCAKLADSESKGGAGGRFNGSAFGGAALVGRKEDAESAVHLQFKNAETSDACSRNSTWKESWTCRSLGTDIDPMLNCFVPVSFTLTTST